MRNGQHTTCYLIYELIYCGVSPVGLHTSDSYLGPQHEHGITSRLKSLRIHVQKENQAGRRGGRGRGEEGEGEGDREEKRKGRGWQEEGEG